MGTRVYSVESYIEHFFNTLTTATRAECDIRAASLVGEPVRPSPVQGLWSYTVTAGPSQADIVQFRAGRSALDMANINIAILVHSWCVPRCSYHGQIGGDSPLSIYVMEKRDGVCYIQTRDMSPEGKAEFEVRQFRTVADLARFFAGAWNRPQKVSLAVADNLRHEMEIDLDRLSDKLPDRFMTTLNQVRKDLPRIFSLPFVITHGDLNESNILVNNDGYITAIIDWAESRILPFGISLWGLENVLGYMDGTGWHYHDNAKDLRDEFWRVFEINAGGIHEEVKKNIRLARMAGLFLRYGFEQDGSARGKVRDTHFALRYADSFSAYEHFLISCRKVEDRNEARVIRDITPLVVPSAEILCTYGAKHLDPLIESIDEGWNNSIPLTTTRPQPDYSVGFKREAFTDDQLDKLSPCIGDFIAGDKSFFMATYYMYFPFLTCEVKCGAAALDIADRQNAHSMTLAVRATVELFRTVERQDEVNRQILAFSISHDHRSVRIYGHYAVINGKNTKYYRHPIYEFSFTALNRKEKWTAYRFTRNVYDIWMPTHFKRICSAIDQLPELDFDVPSQPEAGLSQDLETLIRSVGSASLPVERDSQSSNVGQGQVTTPGTSFTVPQGAKKKKAKK